MLKTFSFVFTLSLSIGVAVTQQEGALRLAGQGADSSQGRLEIYHNGQWGTVCDDQFLVVDASVVCHQLGFVRDRASVTTQNFGTGTGVIWLDDVDCDGTEVRLDQCRHSGWNNSNCAHSEDVAVKCGSAVAPTAPAIPTTTKSPNVVQESNCTVPDSRIRIIGPSNLPGTGVVQVLNNNKWGGVCDNDWDINDARVVCRSLCYDPAKALAGSIAFDISNITQPMTVSTMSCAGTESSLVNCPQTSWVDAGGACSQSEKARVTCEEMDNSAPARPEPIIRCTNGMISASFSTITDPHLEPKHLSVDVAFTGVCGVEKTNSTDFITISVPFDECGTEATFNSTHIIYKTQIRYLPTFSSGSISHSNTYIFKIQCELPRRVDAGKPIVPITETITERAPGNFEVSLSFFKDPLFSNPETNFPLEIPLGAWLGGAVELRDVDRNSKLIVPDCYATPTNERIHDTNRTLFTDKCIEDPTVGFFPFNDTTFAWRYQTFRFTNYPEVHIHCNALICLKDDVDPECDRSCVATTTTASTTTAGTGAGTTSGASAGRRRRSVQSYRRIIQLSGPTMIVYNANQDGPGDETTTRPVLQTTTAPVVKSSKATSSNVEHGISPDSTTVRSAQTFPPPYLGEADTVISDDAPGAGAIPKISIFFVMCLSILSVVHTNMQGFA